MRFFSPPENPSLTARRTSSGVDFHLLDLGVEEALELAGRHLLLAVVHAASIDSGLEELPGADAGQLYGVLESEEHAHAGADFGFQGQQVLAVVDGLSAGDGVVGPASQNVGKGALAGAVGAHDGVHFASVDLEVYAVQDIEIARRGAEAADGEQRVVVGHCRIRF